MPLMKRRRVLSALRASTNAVSSIASSGRIGRIATRSPSASSRTTRGSPDRAGSRGARRDGLCGARPHHDARIHGDHAVLVGEERVDVELLDLRQLAGHLRHAQQHRLERARDRPQAGRGTRPASVPRASRGSCPSTSFALSGGSATARSRSTSIAMPPGAERHRGAEDGIAHDARHELAAVGARRHGLHRNAAHLALRRVRAPREP